MIAFFTHLETPVVIGVVKYFKNSCKKAERKPMLVTLIEGEKFRKFEMRKREFF
jgi:hypothetical protein